MLFRSVGCPDLDLSLRVIASRGHSYRAVKDIPQRDFVSSLIRVDDNRRLHAAVSSSEIKTPRAFRMGITTSMIRFLICITEPMGSIENTTEVG